MACLVDSAQPLEEIETKADIIFKGTAVSNEPSRDKWFEPSANFVVEETEFKVISAIKGDDLGGIVRFHHYDLKPKLRGAWGPQFYHFEPGRAYVVFAKKAGTPAIFRQLWVNSNRGIRDQGALLCLDNSPVTARTVKEVFWTELTAMLKSVVVSDLAYAIHQLDEMSSVEKNYDRTQDFDRGEVLKAVHGLMMNGDPQVAQAAIALVGSENPYLIDWHAQSWLATVGSAEVPGFSRMDPKKRNIGGELYWKELRAVADGKVPDATRALAIRALGLVREPALKSEIDRWVADAVPAVRASATLLLADYPGADAGRQLTALAGDPAPAVRKSAAYASGFAQRAELVDVLARLLSDNEPDVRCAAAMSLLSFSPKDEAIAKVFRANLDNLEFAPLFLNALAAENPKPYLDAISRVVVERPDPRNWPGGQVPAYTAWIILYKYLETQPVEDLRSGKHDRYLDVMEKVHISSSSTPCYIYAFYLRHGMTVRAKRYREAAKKEATYDLDHFFDAVDQNPENDKP